MTPPLILRRPTAETFDLTAPALVGEALLTRGFRRPRGSARCRRRRDRFAQQLGHPRHRGFAVAQLGSMLARGHGDDAVDQPIREPVEGART